MRIPAWRLALTGGALILLVAAAVGVASAGTPPADPGLDGAADALAASVVGGGRAGQAFDRPLARHGRELVHGTVTIDDVDQGLMTFQLDGGTIAAVDADSVTVKEADGASVTVEIDEGTWVRIDRHRAEPGDLKPGQEVYVCSRIGEGGAATARLIVAPPAGAD